MSACACRSSIARFLPFSVLLGTLITLATLNQHSEIISMKAAGISAHQIIAPLILAAALIVAVLNFAFNERVVTRANAALERLGGGRIWPGAAGQPASRTTSALTHGDDLIFVRQVTGQGDDVRLAGITIYDRTGGTLRRILTAETGATRRAAAGSCATSTCFTSTPAAQARMARAMLRRDARSPTSSPSPRSIPTSRTSGRCASRSPTLAAAGRPTATLEASLWHKIAGPLSTVLMPLLAAVAAFGLARSGQLFVRAVIGMALGFAYFVADNFALAMGNFGAYPPFLAAWGPFLLFLLVGEAVLIRTEE